MAFTHTTVQEADVERPILHFLGGEDSVGRYGLVKSLGVVIEVLVAGDAEGEILKGGIYGKLLDSINSLYHYKLIISLYMARKKQI